MSETIVVELSKTESGTLYVEYGPRMWCMDLEHKRSVDNFIESFDLSHLLKNGCRIVCRMTLEPRLEK